jgi:hypothetical protein
MAILNGVDHTKKKPDFNDEKKIHLKKNNESF